jgi:hypothetical protein
MAIVKKRNEESVMALLLEEGDEIELPPAEIDEVTIILNSESYRQFLPELLEELREGTTAEPVAVVNDGATLAIEGKTRTFWVKLWHKTDSDLTEIERAHVVSCLPNNKNVRIVFNNEF